jgi:hypothetical protein
MSKIRGRMESILEYTDYEFKMSDLWRGIDDNRGRTKSICCQKNGFSDYRCFCQKQLGINLQMTKILYRMFTSSFSAMETGQVVLWLSLISVLNALVVFYLQIVLLTVRHPKPRMLLLLSESANTSCL